MQPFQRSDENIQFPVVYLTDANMNFGFATSVSHALQIAGFVERFVLVGIGYATTNPLGGALLRWRDLTPSYRPRILYHEMDGFQDVLQPSVGSPCWGGSGEFKQFISRELIPFIDARYGTAGSPKVYAGHSLGGGFGLEMTFDYDNLFHHCIVASPSLSFGGHDYGLDHIRARIRAGACPRGRLFVGIGALEDSEAPNGAGEAAFLASYHKVMALLEDIRAPEFLLSGKVFDGETHASVWPMAFSHGLRFCLGAEQKSVLGMMSDERRSVVSEDIVALCSSMDRFGDV